MMCDPEYVETRKLQDHDDDLADDGDEGMEPDSTEVTSSDDEPPSTLEQACHEWQARSQKQPGDTAKRAGPSDITND